MRENQFAYAGWDNLEFEEWQSNMRLWLQECHRVLKKTRDTNYLYGCY